MSNVSKEPQRQRRFTEKEVGAILRRAVELQAARTGENALSDTPSGTSLTQLQQAALELGIEPALVQEAAVEVMSGHLPGERGSFWGGPWRSERECLLEGTVAEEDWPALLGEIRRVSGRVGVVNQVGKSFEWSSSSPDLLHVTILPQAQGVKVRVMGKWGEWSGAIYLPTLIAALFVTLGVCASQHLSLLAGSALAASLFSGAFLGARTVFNRICSMKRRQVDTLMQRLEEVMVQARSSEPQTAAPITGYEETTDAADTQALGVV